MTNPLRGTFGTFARKWDVWDASRWVKSGTFGTFGEKWAVWDVCRSGREGQTSQTSLAREAKNQKIDSLSLYSHT